MYIVINNNPEKPVLISRKLHKALNLNDKNNPSGAISISRIKGTNRFCIIRRQPEETFQQQCSLVTPHPMRDRRTPSVFHWTTPSLEYIKVITGLQIITTKVIKVKPRTMPTGITLYILQI